MILRRAIHILPTQHYMSAGLGNLNGKEAYRVRYVPSALVLRDSSSGGTNGSVNADTRYPVMRVALRR